jgi:hypothetical protein
MRQIKFRAWDKKREIMLAVDNLDINECEILLRAEHSYIPISNVEIMQKLSLKDFNDNPIYEGDILEKRAYDGQEYTLVSIVVWNGDGFCLETIKHHNPESIGDHYSLPHYSPPSSKYPSPRPLRAVDMPEIIGNIYENPELLRVNDE